MAGVRHRLADQPGRGLASGPVGAPAAPFGWAFGLPAALGTVASIVVYVLLALLALLALLGPKARPQPEITG